jgi:hypothetical protein
MPNFFSTQKPLEYGSSASVCGAGSGGILICILQKKKSYSFCTLYGKGKSQECIVIVIIY